MEHDLPCNKLCGKGLYDDPDTYFVHILGHIWFICGVNPGGDEKLGQAWRTTRT